MTDRDPEFFDALSRGQKPRCLWIGCSDSRVSPSLIADSLPGELFVHRNIANVVAGEDVNCLSAIQYAVEVLEVPHVIVCGHYGCGGIRAALGKRRSGPIDDWLVGVREVAEKHRVALGALGDEGARCDRLCELNAIEQAARACRTSSVRDAWARGQPLSVHGWIYDLRAGLLRDLDFRVSRAQELETAYASALSGLAAAGRPADCGGSGM